MALETSEALASGDGAGEPKASWAGEALKELRRCCCGAVGPVDWVEEGRGVPTTLA